VQVVMREEGDRMLFQPDKLTVRAGEQVRFLLRNNGRIDHELIRDRSSRCCAAGSVPARPPAR